MPHRPKNAGPDSPKPGGRSLRARVALLAGGGLAALVAVALIAVSLTDASLRYRDEAVGLNIQVEDCRLSLPQPAVAANSAGSMLAATAT